VEFGHAAYEKPDWSRARPADRRRPRKLGTLREVRAHLLKRPEVALRKWSVSQRVNSSRTAGDDHTLIEPAALAA
jgi:hypothetical protein